jgi:hypothetical protein
MINSRPWCPECAKQHLPASGDDMRNSLLWGARILAVLAGILLPLIFLPGFIGKVAVASMVGVVLGKVLFVRDTREVRIEELKGGREVRSLRVSV